MIKAEVEENDRLEEEMRRHNDVSNRINAYQR